MFGLGFGISVFGLGFGRSVPELGRSVLGLGRSVLGLGLGLGLGFMPKPMGMGLRLRLGLGLGLGFGVRAWDGNRSRGSRARPGRIPRSGPPGISDFDVSTHIRARRFTRHDTPAGGFGGARDPWSRDAETTRLNKRALLRARTDNHLPGAFGISAHRAPRCVAVLVGLVRLGLNMPCCTCDVDVRRHHR